MKLFDLINRLRALQESLRNLQQDRRVSAEEVSLLGVTIEHIMEREKSVLTIKASLKEAVGALDKESE